MNRLTVPPATKQQLAELGVESPLELLGMIYAARSEFERLLGAETVAKVVQALEEMATPEELVELQLPLPKVSLGARTDPYPGYPRPAKS